MRKRQLTVLVVDDYKIIVERLTSLLEELEEVESVVSAGSYAESVAVLESNPADVALLDIHLPDRSGIDLLDFIKATYAHMRVIMMSDRVHPKYEAICLEKGADHVIDKSNDFEMIPHFISRL